MVLNDSRLKQYSKDRTLSIVLLISLPLSLLIAALILNNMGDVLGGEYYFMLYITLIVALIEPSFGFYFSNTLLKLNIQNKYTEKENFHKLISSINLVRVSLVLSTYFFGFVLFLLSRDITFLFYFFPIGIFWSYLYYPRLSWYEKMYNKAEELTLKFRNNEENKNG